ncbi:MAG: hypothetical protein A2W22_00480 [Candidatus Levybacteria bacterium RBG_16_35_11]|nr:MAG: hypothetical protein A2W22_00480 [Candidatus Levybacteria bacterium RBG_16_35_11]
MSIKKSFLEKKLLYRATKVFFLILPILVIFLLLSGKINICDTSQKSALDILQKNIVYIAIGLTSYFLILIAVWRLFLYIAFGGLEDDMKKEEGDQSAQVKSKSPKIMQLIPILIILAVVITFILSEMGYITLPKIDLDNVNVKNVENVENAPRSACPATSAQTATPCNSVRNGIKTSGVIVPASCSCPSDTTYAQMDNITAGGPYRICTCN